MEQSSNLQVTWHICKNKEKLWVQWVHAYYLKGHTVWETNPKNASWIIQKIFKSRRYLLSAGYSENDLSLTDNFSIKTVYKKLTRGICKGTLEETYLQQQRMPQVDFYLKISHS